MIKKKLYYKRYRYYRYNPHGRLMKNLKKHEEIKHVEKFRFKT